MSVHLRRLVTFVLILFFVRFARAAPAVADDVDEGDRDAIEANQDAELVRRQSGVFGGARGSFAVSIIGAIDSYGVATGPPMTGWQVTVLVLLPLDRLFMGGGAHARADRLTADEAIARWMSDTMTDANTRERTTSMQSPNSTKKLRFLGTLTSATIALGVPLAFADPTRTHGLATSTSPSASASGASVRALPSSSSSASMAAISSSLARPASSAKLPLQRAVTRTSGATASDDEVATEHEIPLFVMTPTIVRGLVVGAWRTMGLDRDGAIDDLASRARSSALLPEVRLRAHRSVGLDAEVEATELATDRTYSTDLAQTMYEARLTWRLDRLVFAEEEVSIERVRLDRSELKQRVAARVVDLCLSLVRSSAASHDPALLATERAEATLLFVEARLALDAMTDGEASRVLPAP